MEVREVSNTQEGRHVKESRQAVEKNEAIIQKIVEAYPTKVARERQKHLVVHKPGDPDQRIQADVLTIPGIMTNRG